MMKIKRVTSFLAALLLLIPALPNVFAEPIPDPEQTGSITVQMTYRGETVPGGSVTLYRLAGLDDAYQYISEPEFAGCSVDLNGTLTASAAKTLADYAKRNHISGQTKSLGADGTAVFSPLETGLYLLVQQEAGSGYLPINPFFADVPQQIGKELIYDVDASPKCAPESTKPTKPAEPAEPSKPHTPNIPQTGQLNWPVPVMAALGLSLFAAGWFLRFGRRRNDYDA